MSWAKSSASAGLEGVYTEGSGKGGISVGRVSDDGGPPSSRR